MSVENNISIALEKVNEDIYPQNLLEELKKSFENDVSENDVSENDVSENDVSENDVSENDVSEIEYNNHGIPEITPSYIEVMRPNLCKELNNSFLQDTFDILVDTNEFLISDELYPFKELKHLASSMGVELTD